MSFWHLSFPHTFLTSLARAVRFCSSTCHLLHGPSRKRPSTKPPACPAAVTVFLQSASSIAIAPSANGQQRKFLMHIVYAIRTAPTQYIMSPAPHGDQSITSELRLRLSGSPRSSWASSPPPPRPHPALHPTGRALEPLAPVPHPQRLEHRPGSPRGTCGRRSPAAAARPPRRHSHPCRSGRPSFSLPQLVPPPLAPQPPLQPALTVGWGRRLGAHCTVCCVESSERVRVSENIF